MELNKIYCEDCRETMKRMPNDFVDLVVTSPPYDDLRDYHGCSWNFDIFKEIASELHRVTKPGGVVVWVVNDSTIDGSETVTSAKQKIHFHEIGFNIHDTMIYEKNGASYPSKDKYYQVFEYMFVFSKGKPKAYNPIKDRVNRWAGQKWSKKRTRRTKTGELVQQDWYVEQDNLTGVRFNIWKYNNGAGYSSEEEFAHEHPAIFPEQLAADHIHSWSNENDLVFDPFGGSGTVAKKAIQMKRNWIISEIALEYVAIAEKRIAPHLQQLNLAI